MFHNNDILLRDLQTASGEPLSHIIICLALEFERSYEGNIIPDYLCDFVDELYYSIKILKWPQVYLASGFFALSKCAGKINAPDVQSLAASILNKVEEPFFARQILICIEDYIESGSHKNIAALREIAAIVEERKMVWGMDEDLVTRFKSLLNS